ncbi:SDR family NAD(P)-dependent oxidoreductase [Roseobacter sinensis]|uniref:SDR family oxidoreductase n=1 Tax=Roseobacter sinensis TaxID=2931391 RepID=A0ABT3BJS4_9RHOB|nr:SDR family oxidoreductase [Roseobacter sp. WL0113]MCV3273825.1 SDR family oxidoreductase [Roseobacter sp. WL0113]
MPPLFDVSDKTACVTGASSGLGRQAARLLAEAGARVVGLARRADQLSAWQQETAGETATVAADLSDRTALRGIATAVTAPFGPIDILVNAAGINTRQHADEVTDDGWDITLNLNLAAPFFLAQKLVPAMKDKGWGRIINFASLQSRRAFANGITYGASKGAVEQMTRAMAEAWSGNGITANALAPGFFRTELTGPVFADAARAQRNADQTCIGRNGEPADLDGPLMFFCSPASDYVTGQVLFVDGGFTAK